MHSNRLSSLALNYFLHVEATLGVSGCYFHLFQGVFVAFVHDNSPASMGGLRFGDQVLQINGDNVAGWDSKKAMKCLEKAAPEKITFAVRDR